MSVSPATLPLRRVVIGPKRLASGMRVVFCCSAKQRVSTDARALERSSSQRTLARLHGVLKQHRNRHGAYPSWDGGDRRSHRHGCRVVDIADKAVAPLLGGIICEGLRTRGAAEGVAVHGHANKSRLQGMLPPVEVRFAAGVTHQLS